MSDRTSGHTAEPQPVVEPVPAALHQLDARDEAILAFERQWWRHVGAKEEAIRSTFSLSAARYYQILGTLVDSPLALAHDPMLIKRLQRMRTLRADARSGRSLPGPT